LTEAEWTESCQNGTLIINEQETSHLRSGSWFCKIAAMPPRAIVQPDAMTFQTTDRSSPHYRIAEPIGRRTPLVFNSPHSGANYPEEFLAASKLDANTLRRSEDMDVDALFEGVTARGAPLLAADFPRAFLDVNREPFELDQRMFETRLPDFVNTRSMRVAGGLGTIARMVGEAQEIYARKLSVAEGLDRIERLYRPYHRALRGLVQDTHARFGFVLLVDCHSMPSGPMQTDHGARADIVIGDRYGTSCAGLFSDVIEDSLRAFGYRVARNKPYAGGFITEHYGHPASGCHAVQIEINRALYMDERRYLRTDGFAPLKTQLMGMVEVLADAAEHCLPGRRFAAE
jgi:N-formylglutamate amidohydrolase